VYASPICRIQHKHRDVCGTDEGVSHIFRPSGALEDSRQKAEGDRQRAAATGREFKAPVSKSRRKKRRGDAAAHVAQALAACGSLVMGKTASQGSAEGRKQKAANQKNGGMRKPPAAFSDFTSFRQSGMDWNRLMSRKGQVPAAIHGVAALIVILCSAAYWLAAAVAARAGVASTAGNPGWKTYRNNRFGFQFRYPPDRSVSDGGPYASRSGTQPDSLDTLQIRAKGDRLEKDISVFSPGIVHGDYDWPERPCGEWTFGPDHGPLSSERIWFAGQKTLHVMARNCGGADSPQTNNYYCVNYPLLRELSSKSGRHRRFRPAAVARDSTNPRIVSLLQELAIVQRQAGQRAGCPAGTQRQVTMLVGYLG
jgi:hypothetical protein